MSSGPEPGREAAAEEREEERAEERTEAPAVEETAAEPAPAPAPAAEESGRPGEAAEGVQSAEEPTDPDDSHARAERETGAAEPRSVTPVRLTKPAEPEPAVAEGDAHGGPEEPAGPEAVEEPQDADRAAGRRRLKAALWPPRLSRGQLVVALLLFSLGLGLAIQVRSTNDHHNQLRGARQEDLVRILDELDSRQQRLQQEKAELEQSLGKLENSSNQAKEAQEQTRKKMTELGVLAGTVKATGPGIVLTVDDPQGQVKADMLLDTLQELRAAGAEAIQINDVRVVVNTYFTDLSGGGVQIDGKKVSQPYRFTVVGNPQDLTPALNIPGGVVRTLESHQARATIAQQQKVVVDALVDLKTPQYAKPAAK